MKAWQYIRAVLVTTGFVVFLMLVMPVQTRTQPADAITFDHSNCQYPERWTNPADGCDNTDPAVPECIKASFSQESEKACIDAFVAQHNEPVQSEPVPTTQASEQQTYSCGGK